MNAMNDVATLRTIIGRSRDADGYRNGSVTRDMVVYCKANTASRAEVYEALRSGIRVQMIAQINADDYRAACVVSDGRKYRPSVFLFDNTEYSIARAYQKDDITMELSLSEVE
jgi:hypothetical protein